MIELPKDAKGREIPLDTKVLYLEDGSGHRVLKWEFYQDNNIPWVVTLETGNTRTYRCPDCVYLTPPDSWEKLLDDLGMVEDYVDTSALNGPACFYMHNADKSCDTCKLYGGTPCVSKMCADIADRIRKLRGEDE